MRSRIICSMFVAVALAVCAPLAWSEIKPEDEALLKEVSKKLLGVAKPPTTVPWPPLIRIEDTTEIDAYATVLERNDKSRYSTVVISQGLLDEVIRGDADRLAYVVGHELSHIILRHVYYDGQEKTPKVNEAFTRAQEAAADVRGMQYVGQAGFLPSRARKAIHQMIALNMEYSALDGLSKDHPSWKDRLATIDKDQRSIWRSMSSYEVGNQLLVFEQYAGAEQCFAKVAREFPSAAEAWANLGYARLMRYCDLLEADDLRQLGITGQLAVGAFYQRPKSIEDQVRGIAADIWTGAVAALREAERRDPKLVMVKGNLALAHLVNPDGKDLPNATKAMQEAVAAVIAKKDEMPVDPMAYVAMTVNMGVIDLTAGRTTSAHQRLDVAEDLFKQFDTTSKNVELQPGILSAMIYNRALLRLASKDPKDRTWARDNFELWLQNNSPSSTWWPLVFDQYKSACKLTGVQAKAASELTPASDYQRPPLEVTFAGKPTVALAAETDDVIASLGPPETVPIVSGVNLHKYPALGGDLLADERIIAIRLNGAASPPVVLQASGLGTKKSEIRVGMSQKDFEELLGPDALAWDFCRFFETDPGQSYRYYRNQAVAIRYDGDKIGEILIAQFPVKLRDPAQSEGSESPSANR